MTCGRDGCSVAVVLLIELYSSVLADRLIQLVNGSSALDSTTGQGFF